MNNKVLIVLCLACAILLGVSVNNIALSSNNNTNGIKIGIVDLSQLITNSASVKSLKISHEKQLNDIEKTLEQARSEIANESNPDKIAQLEEKYRKDVNDKKLQMDKNYNEKLLEIDKNIKTQIAHKAKELNYTIILPKNIVLYGGEDITNQIANAIK